MRRLVVGACVLLLGASCAKDPPLSTGTGGSGGGGPIGARATIAIAGTPTRPVAPTFFGGNYWSYVRQFGNQVAGTEALVRDLRLKVLRIGGTNADTGAPELFTPDVVAEMVTYARSVGAEPLVQVANLTDPRGLAMTAESAGALVRELNVDRALGIKYFAIGNEPDIYVDSGHLPAYSAEEAATRFASWSDAMKAADPTIEIVGPDLSWRYQIGTANDWLSPFLARCKDKVDVVAFHRYPLDPAQAIDTAAFADAPRFRAVVRSLRAALDGAGMTQTPLALTEYNVTWDGTPATSTLSASPGTLPAALWMGDLIGVGLEEGLWSMDFWSISEGWTLGVLDGLRPRPAYEVLKLWAGHAGTDVVTTTSSNPAVSAYATTAAAAGITLVVINKSNVDVPETVTFAGITPPLASVAHTFAGRSISVVTVTATAAPVVITYGQDEATRQVGPTRLP